MNACGAESIATAEVVVPANRPQSRFLDADASGLEEAQLDAIEVTPSVFLPLIDR